MKKIINLEVETPEGKGTLKEIYVTELGYIMVKIYYASQKVFVNHKIADMKNLLDAKFL